MKEILDKIKNNIHINDPYPHMVINDFLSKTLLENINKEWNNKEFIDRFNNYCINTHNKKIIISGYGSFKKIISISEPFQQVYNIFMNIDLFTIFCNKFKHDMKKHINPNITIDNLKPDLKFFVCMCKSNYQCNPHIDYRKCIFSILIYPDIIDYNDSRLNIYELKDKNIEVADIYPDINDLILRDSIKSCFNKAVISLNVPHSYHSVKPYKYKIKDFSKLRHYIYVSYNIQADIEPKDFWIKGAKIFSQERKHKYLFESK